VEEAKEQFSIQTWTSASFILVSVALASKGLGLLRDILMAKYFGASAEVDAFMVGLSLPMLIGGGIGFAFSTALVPTYRKVLANSGMIRANRLAGTVVMTGMSIMALLMIPLFITPLPLIELIVPSLSEPTTNLAAELTPWLSMYAIGLSGIFMIASVYHAFYHFKIPAFTDLAHNSIIILCLVAFALPFGIYALVYGYIFATFFCMFIQVFFIIKRRLHGFGWHFQFKGFKDFLHLAIPILVFDSLTQLSIVIENYFASGLTEGSIAALNYAKRLPVAITLLIAVSVARGVFPTLSEMYSKQKIKEAKLLLAKINMQLIILFVPLTALLIFFRKQLMSILFMRGAFDNTALELTSLAFLFYAAGLMIAAFEPVYLRACYAFSDTVMPLFSIVLSLILVIPLNYFLAPRLGLAGIALTMNFAYLIRVSILAYSLKKKLGKLDIRKMFRGVLVSLICALAALLPISILPNDQVVSLLISVLLFFIFYFGLGSLVMKNEIRTMWRLLSQSFENHSTGL
jgi:putative peptidoglycan lipid II flippase